MPILVTGAAGFIGYHVSTALLEQGIGVAGVDSMNDYYAPALKHARLEQLSRFRNFAFYKTDIADYTALAAIPEIRDIRCAIHLAAQAGVRHSIDNPFAYTHANITGHLSVLELARHFRFDHLVYASSSSVYGANTLSPFSEGHRTDSPVSLYGATKKSGEMLSRSYAHLYRIPQTGLRFFTVYGPWGRPDMAYWIFTDRMLRGETVDIFNHGNMGRDFTYIDDIVSGILAALENPPGKSRSFHRLYNLGNDRPENLMTMVSLLEKALGVNARKNMTDMQKGDVERTWADIAQARDDLGYAPSVSLEEGIERFVSWRKGFPGNFS